ncbi:MAG: ribokinase [Wenzhouxiangellaceae bacterium]
MRIFNFGSLNIDHVYRVSELVPPGATITAQEYRQFCGGKGLNQSIALARAGASVVHVGVIGHDGELLLQALRDDSVDTGMVRRIDSASGHAVIQVSDSGDNAIIVHPGANQMLSEAQIDAALQQASPGDWVLCQNETSGVEYLLHKASAAGLHIACNPAPMTPAACDYPYHLLDLLLVNQTEAETITGCSDHQAVLEGLQQLCPNGIIVLTLGARGALACRHGQWLQQPAQQVKVIDSTAAGDTFCGYFLYALSQNKPLQQCLQQASEAAAACVQQAGAAESIPRMSNTKSS